MRLRRDAIGPYEGVLRKLGGAAVIESGPIDDGLVAWQTKKSWPRITRLRLQGDRTGLNKSKTQRRQGIKSDPVLIKARRQPDRIWEAQSEAMKFTEG